mmetsp:Transcript_12691/g.19189  ORF Transcript_12691/g.19189 Transcript_12691/m.19189 type:complete len:427 (-) Transcript_12691:64-1344(-)
MNTRLQVEHPVTELITGQDLVEHMINVAAGKPLSIKQSDVQINGWATESRVYAEDPLRNFLPSIGRLLSYQEPAERVMLPLKYPNKEAYARCDSGVSEGSEISVYYDPLIAKLITYAPTREQSIAAMRIALDNYVIRGLSNNLNFLRSVLTHPRYLSGNITTKFIEEEYADGFHGHQLSEEETLDLLLSSTIFQYTKIMHSKSHAQGGAISMLENPAASFEHFYVHIGDELVPKDPNATESAAVASMENFVHVAVSQNFDEKSAQDYPLEIAIIDENHEPVQSFKANPDFDKNGLLLNLDVENHNVITTQKIANNESGWELQHCSNQYHVSVYTEQEMYTLPFLPNKIPFDAGNVLVSPMPGTVIQYHVAPGDVVEPGQPLVTVEAMKMQNVLKAEKKATIASLSVKDGESVSVDAVLIEFADENE